MKWLTVRLGRDVGRISQDDGRSKVLGPVEIRAVYQILQGVLDSPAPWVSDGLTAGAAAGLAEALLARPLERAWESPQSPNGDDDESIALASDSEVSMPFKELIARRRSRRFLGPCTLSQLAQVLIGTYAVHEEAVAPDGYRLTHRPV